MFPSTAQKSGTNDAFNLRFEDFLALQPPFLAQKYTFWSYDPRRNACCAWVEIARDCA